MPKITISLTLVALALAACESGPSETMKASSAKRGSPSVPIVEPGAPSLDEKPTFEAPKTEAIPAAVLPSAPPTPRVESEVPRARLTESEDDETCRVTLNRLEMASNIEKREPVLLGEKAAANGDAIYAFTDFKNAGPGAEKVLVEWTHPASGHYFAYDVEVARHKRYRTWTRHPIPARREGTWVVRVKDADGCVIGETTFDAEPELEPEDLVLDH
jgi:hypothetical protein